MNSSHFVPIRGLTNWLARGVRHCALGGLLLVAPAIWAAPTDLADAPIQAGHISRGKPNLMVVMDTSLSMRFTHAPDEVETVNLNYPNDPTTPLGDAYLNLPVGYRSPQCNALYYNPNSIENGGYKLPVDATGASLPQPNFYNAFYNYYEDKNSATPRMVNLSTSFQAFDQTTRSNGTTSAANDTPRLAYYWVFKFSAAGGYQAYIPTSLPPTGAACTSVPDSPAYYPTLADGSVDMSDFVGPQVIEPNVGGVPSPGNWIRRYIPLDGLASSVAQRDEFARWYTYYRTRIALAKTGMSLGFKGLGDDFRVGFITASPLLKEAGEPIIPLEVDSSKFLKLNDFGATQKAAFYSKMTGQKPSGSSPMREALARVGRHYGLKSDGINNQMDTSTVDPQDANNLGNTCRSNYAVLLTDGYWNASEETKGPVQLDGVTPVGQQDGSLSSESGNTPRPIWDGSLDSYAITWSHVYSYRDAPCALGGTIHKVTSQVQKRTVQHKKPASGYNQYFVQRKQAQWQYSYTRTTHVRTAVLQQARAYQYQYAEDGNSWFGVSTCDTTKPLICRLRQFQEQVVPVGTCSASTDANFVVTTCPTVTVPTNQASCPATPETPNAAAGEISVNCQFSNVTSWVSNCVDYPSGTVGNVQASCTSTQTQPLTDVGSCVQRYDEGSHTFTQCSNVYSGNMVVTSCAPGTVSVDDGVNTQTVCAAITGLNPVPACDAGDTSCTTVDSGWQNSSCTASAASAPDWITTTCSESVPVESDVPFEQCPTAGTTVTPGGVKTTCSGDFTAAQGHKVVETTWIKRLRYQMAGGSLIGEGTPLNEAQDQESAMVKRDVPIAPGGPSCVPLSQPLKQFNWDPTNPTSYDPFPTADSYFTDSYFNLIWWPLAYGQEFWWLPTAPPALPTLGGAPIPTCNSWDLCYISWADPAAAAQAGSRNSLADVAQYYYVTDLRPDLADNVQKAGTRAEDDRLQSQHMTTFVVGLGVSGNLRYDKDYLSGRGDFRSLRNNGQKFWDDTIGEERIGKSWPIWPSADAEVAIAAKDNASLSDKRSIDDFWHTAVNGRGRYYNAKDASAFEEVVKGVQDAANSSAGSGAGAAVASQVVTVSADIFETSFLTGVWTGDLVGRVINGAGYIAGVASWSAKTMLQQKVGDDCAERSIWVISPGSDYGNNIVPFTWNSKDYCSPYAPYQSQLPTALRGFVDGSKVELLSQFAGASTGTAAQQAQLAAAKADGVLLNYLRGVRGNEGFISGDSTKFFRRRASALGDIVNSQPAYVGAGTPYNYTDTDFQNWKTSEYHIAGRSPAVYVGANDGMLHVFYAPRGCADAVNCSTASDAGLEFYTVIPSSVLPNLYQLADEAWPSLHKYSVDGSPITADIRLPSTACTVDTPWEYCWRTILVGGLNKGGKGYYALDVTYPNSGDPKALWEFKKTLAGSGTSCDVVVGASSDCNLGYTYGRPIITKMADGTWVALVTSGYNNGTDGGDGKGYLYVLNAFTGKLIKRIGTGVGSTTTPSGLREITMYASNPSTDNTATRVYAGDLLGNIWRFDINSTDTTGVLVTTLTNSAGQVQPITNRMNVVEIDGDTYILVGTGKLLGSPDVVDTTVQSVYAIKDPLTNTSPNIAAETLRSLALKKMTFTVGAGDLGYVQDGAVALAPNLSRTLNCDSASGNCGSAQGWFVDLPIAGERVNIDMAAGLGTLVFFSNIPGGTDCTDGHSIINQLDIKTGMSHESRYAANALAVGGQLLTGTGTDCASQVYIHESFADGSSKNICLISSELPPIGKKVSWREVTK